MRSLLKTMFVVLLALLWVPITAHCLLESAGWLPKILCCSDACPGGNPNQGDEDACKSIESASYKVAGERVVLVVQVLPALITDLLESLDSLSVASGISRPSMVAAPEDPVTWQFTHRTALPPRAPSFAS